MHTKVIEGESFSNMDLDDKQMLTLRILYGVILLGEICNLLASVYIICFYMIRLRVKSMLIILFYFTANFATICYTITLIQYLRDPNKMFYDYNQPPSKDVAAICKEMADCAIIALGFVVLVNMYKITVSIQVLYGEITVK